MDVFLLVHPIEKRENHIVHLLMHCRHSFYRGRLIWIVVRLIRFATSRAPTNVVGQRRLSWPAALFRTRTAKAAVLVQQSGRHTISYAVTQLKRNTNKNRLVRSVAVQSNFQQSVPWMRLNWISPSGTIQDSWNFPTHTALKDELFRPSPVWSGTTRNATIEWIKQCFAKVFKINK